MWIPMIFWVHLSLFPSSSLEISRSKCNIMELRQYFLIVWKWLWLILLGVALAGGAAYVVSKRTAPVYRASTTLLINEARNPGQVNYNDILTSERIAKTYAERLTKRPVLEAAAQELGLNLTPRRRFPDMIENISVQPVRDTQLVQLSVESTDPQLAAQLANTLPQVFIKRNEGQLSARYASSKENLARQLTNLQTDIEVTQKAIETERARGSLADPAELARLQNTLTQYQNSYSSLLRSYEEIRLAEAQSLDTIVIDEPAVVPVAPVRPNTLVNILLATVVGAMITVGIAFLIEYLDDTVKTPDDVRQSTGLATLGAIRRVRPMESGGGLITSRHPRSPISEAYRTLRTNIQFSTLDKPLRTLLVTSPGPSEGKSTIAANLAVVIAQAGKSVIVVDSDLRRPTMHKLLGVANGHGLTTAILTEGEADTFVNGQLQPTHVPNLRVLTSGPIPPNPSELLGSQRMKRLIERLQAEADVVVFDSPPVLVVTDAAVLASEVDGVLLVVDAGNTRRDTATRARDTLAQVGANVLGATLNKLAGRGRDGYYYYDYGYYYYDSGTGERSRHRRRTWWQRLLGRPVPTPPMGEGLPTEPPARGSGVGAAAGGDGALAQPPASPLPCPPPLAGEGRVGTSVQDSAG
jgi:non-specific protein-tyrosine kinase